MSYCLRIDGGLVTVLAWLASHAIGGWGVRETAGDEGANEHWHFHLFSEKTIKQLRCSFNRECPDLKGNGKYSLTECRDEDKYARYMAKGGSDGELPEVVWRHGIQYTDDFVAGLHDEFWEANRKLKKRKLGSMIDWLIDESKRQNIGWDDRRKISEIYIRELGVRGKPINLYSMKANLNAVQVALCPDDRAVSALCDRLEQY